MSLHNHSRKPLSIFEALYLITTFINLLCLFCSGVALAIALSTASAKRSPNPHPETSSTQTIQSQTPTYKNQNSQNKSILKPVFPYQPVPETQLWGPNYPALDESILGKGVVTGGFMEELGHSLKPQTYAIFSDSPDQITVLPSGPRNLGVDYVVTDYNIRNWYPGTVTHVGWEGSYGNRAHIQFDVLLPFNGTLYPLKGAYAHAASFSVQAGDTIQQGQVIGKMGGTGGNYPDHVDLRLWIEIDGKIIDVSPNLVDASIKRSAQ